jgi:hypothetical protein
VTVTEALSLITQETRQEEFMKTIDQPSLERLAQRKAALERKQRQRAREKTRSHQAMVDHLEGIKAERVNAQGIARRTQHNQCMLGEIRPGDHSKQPRDRCGTHLVSVLGDSVSRFRLRFRITPVTNTASFKQPQIITPPR